MHLTIRKIFAVVDVHNNHLLRTSFDENKALSEITPERVETHKMILGYCVFDKETGVIPDEADNFHLTLEEALAELEELQGIHFEDW